MRIATNVIRTLLRRPLAPAVVDDRRTWRSIEIYLGALHVARAIERTTDAPNIGIILPTSGLFPVAILGTWLLGRTIVPLNYLLKEQELGYIIDDAGLDAIVTVGPMLQHVAALPPAVRQIRLEELRLKGIPPLRRCRRRGDDHLAALLYTSGTSGRPKGVMLTAGNLAANVRQCCDWVGFTRVDGLLGVLPQFHSFGLTVLTLLPLVVGCKVVYTARFVPRKILQLLREHRPTALVAIPSMYNVLLTTRGAEAEDFRSLRFIVSGGEPLPRAVAEGFQQRFGRVINEGYGLTETAPVTNWCRPSEHRPGSVGKALPGVDIRIVDPQGHIVGPGQDGEIRIRGPNVMPGYYKLPEQTREAFDEQGYFRTGDMGRLDEDGHLYITGRIKEMLIIGGENVFPREIEEVLNAHPAVADSAVIGARDASRGEVPVAFVELTEGMAADELQLRSWCRERLAGFKVPREVRIVQKLPRNATGKIMRRQLTTDTPAVQGTARSA
jgi:long-chain acyl-CoA synthetase